MLNFIEISGRSTTDHFSGSKSICGWHSGAVVNTDKTLQDDPEFKPSWGLFVLPISGRVLSGYSDFLSHSKDMHWVW